MSRLFSALALAFLVAPAAAAPKVRLGIDVLLEERLESLRGKRVILVTHAPSVTSTLEHDAAALRRAGVNLVALMGPEHGVSGAAYAGEGIDDGTSAAIPVYSLFGPNGHKPTPDMLKGADLVLYDLQDLGVRSYTYVTTLARVMEAAAEAGIPVTVLDRPAPLGGTRVEGNVPPPGWTRSFVNWLPVPYVYGMTSGEMARMIAGEGWLPGGKACELTVVPMKGWRRRMLFADTGLAWVPTSPHVPHAASALFYPATGLTGRALDNGVGYTLPFQLLGAPWIDGERFAREMNALALPGIHFRAITYKPFYFTNKDKTLQGVQIHILDAARAPLVPITFLAFEVLRRLHPKHDVFLTMEESMKQEYDELLGGPQTRLHLEAGKPARDLFRLWQPDIDRFLAARRKYLLYNR